MAVTQQKIIERISFLRRRFRPKQRLLCGPMSAVPLVNVALLLTFFVLLNSRFVVQPGIVVNLPTSSFIAGAPQGAAVVTISQEGLVFFDDERVSLDDLQKEFSQVAFERADVPLVIEADGRVQNSVIVRVYNMALEAGIRKVLLATRVTSTPREALR